MPSPRCHSERYSECIDFAFKRHSLSIRIMSFRAVGTIFEDAEYRARNLLFRTASAKTLARIDFLLLLAKVCTAKGSESEIPQSGSASSGDGIAFGMTGMSEQKWSANFRYDKPKGVIPSGRHIFRGRKRSSRNLLFRTAFG